MKDLPHNKRQNLEDIVPISTPFVIYIDPCGACNLKCYFCPTNTVDYNNQQRHKVMTLSLFEKIVDDLKQFENRIRAIHLYTYGEPLINPNIVKMIKMLREADVCDEIRMTTNGLLLTPSLSDDLADSGLSLLRISLNGLSAKDYEETCGKQIDFEDFLKQIEYFYNVSRGKVEFQVKATTGFIRSEEDKRKLYKLFDSMTDYLTIEDILNLWSDFSVEETAENIKTQYIHWINNGNTICAFPLITMGIHSNGQVSPCCNDWKMDISYGDVNTHSLLDIWNNNNLYKLRTSLLSKEYDSLEFCKGCISRTPDNIDDASKTIINKLAKSRIKNSNL